MTWSPGRSAVSSVDAAAAMPDPVMMQKGLHIIVGETERLSEMVEELLDFSRMQSGHFSLQMDTMDILAETNAGVNSGVVHCFSYSPEIALEAIKLGFYVGVGGVVTFKNAKKLKETVERIPLEKIVLETDCPYLAPVPFRAKRNSSLYLEYVVEEIAMLKQTDVETVKEITYKNALDMYRLAE